MSDPADFSALAFALSSTSIAVLLAGRDGETGSSPPGPLNNIPGTSEEDLIRRLRKDDHSAFEIIYRALHPRLIAIAQSYIHSKDIAEELAQDVLLLMWDRRHKWQDTDSIVVYLYATVRNRALKHRRHEGVTDRAAYQARHTGESLGTAGHIESPEALVERENLVEAVASALTSLPDNQQTAFTLRWIHQLDYDAVASIMGISPSAARVHVSRARAILVSIVAGQIK